MALLGAGFGLKRKSRGAQGMSLSIVYGIGISFLYWIALNFCLSLGYGGVMPPLIAAWTGIPNRTCREKTAAWVCGCPSPPMVP